MTPHIVLLGDSIRMGYQRFVAAALPGHEVWGPEENGQSSRHHLASLHRWLDGRAADVIHVNCGLHDLRRDAPDYEHQVPLAEYASNVERLLERLRDHARAVIWATITPVNEFRHSAAKLSRRSAGDVDAWNAAGIAAALRAGVPVNDLHATAPRNEVTDDGVHFTPDGYRSLGHETAAAIRRALDALAKEVRV